MVHYDNGDKEPKAAERDPKAALGIPAYSGKASETYTSLGCGGARDLEFTDNFLIDVPGPDLYVFEVGPDVEPTALAISQDGDSWTRIGGIEGGKAAPRSRLPIQTLPARWPRAAVDRAGHHGHAPLKGRTIGGAQAAFKPRACGQPGDQARQRCPAHAGLSR